MGNGRTTNTELAVMLEGVATKQEGMAAKLDDFITVQRECNKNHDNRLKKVEEGQVALRTRLGVFTGLEALYTTIVAAIAGAFRQQ